MPPVGLCPIYQTRSLTGDRKGANSFRVRVVDVLYVPEETFVIACQDTERLRCRGAWVQYCTVSSTVQ